MPMLLPGSSDFDGGALQNSIYVGINLQNILYGIELLLYFRTMGTLLRSRGVDKKSSSFYSLFSSMMVFLITVWVATSAIFCQKLWLLDSDFPGGPDKYWGEDLSVWYMDWGTTAVIVLQLMTDGLMIYRCRIVWNSYRVIIAPVFLWFSTLVLAVLVDWTSSIPGGNSFAGLSSQFALAYYGTSVFLNTFLTYMICYRIVRHGRRVQEHLGPGYASFYFGVFALIVESMVPYTLSGVAFLVSLGVGSLTSKVFLPVYVLMMCISPQMLILRVLTGRAWDDDTSLRPRSTINFSFGGMSESQYVDSGVRAHLPRLSKVYLPDGHGRVVISQV